MHKTKRTPSILVLLFLATKLVAQQTDTLLLHPENLAEKDIYDPQASDKQHIKIISGSRFPIDAADLPYSTYVITKEEIRRNGYETLVDALKMVPGIRVSQPGTATDGETFQIRGLLGNTYAKVLVNDVPIKTSFQVSMPIGAQLPIKEAERIEIIFGTGASLYGSDAPAGIINIITRESDKPVFMQADLSVGGLGLRSLNIMFGGRLGRDKHILKYFVYGSNVFMEDRKIFGDYYENNSYNFNPATYTQDSTYAKVPNYGGWLGYPIIGETPHQSRRFGIIAKYKRFTVSLESLYRRDHSSLAYNPTAYEYSNIATSIGESTTRFNLNIFKEKEKKNRKTDFTVTFYNTDRNSSNLAVHNSISKMLQKAAEAKARLLGNDSSEVYFGESYDAFLRGPRYLMGFSFDTRVEHVRNYRLFKLLTLTVGFNAKFALGSPLTGLFAMEQDKLFGGLNVKFEEQYHQMSFYYPTQLAGSYTEYNGFGQLFYNGKKLKLAGGINLSSTFYQPGGGQDAISPSFAALWNINERINVRTSVGRAFRQPNPFYKTNSYAILSQSLNTLYRPNTYIQPEETISWESGVRVKTKNNKVGAELTWFLNKTTKLIQYKRTERYFDADSTDFLGELGYTNFDNSYLTYKGGNFSFGAKFINKDVFTLTTQLNYSWLNPTWVVDGISRFPLLNEPLNGNMLQLRNRITPFKKTTLILDLIRFSNMASAYTPKKDPQFWTIDLVGRYAFTDRFDAYIKITNLFNKNYSGILPDADPADLLLYNPQSGRFLRLGMNYLIE
jgi:outer membrane receptor protein involved in Fe transport